jgi:Protein of unknown function (DUF1566)
MNKNLERPAIHRSRALLAIALSALLAACGGGGGEEPPRFESITQGGIAAVRDNQTGIVWAAGLGSSVRPNGYLEPTAVELLQLADLGSVTLRPYFGLLLDASPLIKAADPVNGIANRAWVVDFGVGSEPGGVSDQANVASPDFSHWYILSRRFTTPSVTYPAVAPDGTLTAAGLTWKVCSEGRSWSGFTCTGTAALVAASNAQAFANAANTAEFAQINDWRVPTKQELRSLLQLGNDLSRATLLPSVFSVDALSTLPFYWSNSRSSDNARTWLVDFSGGDDPGGVELAPKDDLAHVRLVRTAR